jgi:uncharacterized membrane protein YgdD (TMEM256/DUF423 family)
MHKTYLKTAAFLGALSVLLGAFAAHKLKTLVSDVAVNTFETGVRYQFYHVFALLAVGVLYANYPNKLLKAAGWLFIAGIVFFSGSLYLLTYKEAAVLPGLKWVGPITPIGGAFFIAGWVCLALGIKKK